MATATEMTLALGRTVYGGDQSGETGGGERIEGRETRLSVTWRLTEEEQDLTLMASVLAEEAERALKQAERALKQAERALKQADRTVRKGSSPEQSGNMETVQSGNIETVPPLSNGPNPATDTGGVSTERQTTTGTSTECAHAGNGNGHSSEHSRQPASSCSPAGQATPHQNGGKAPTAKGPAANGSSTGSSGYPAYVPPITKPQQLAIQSHCTRHGVADWELRRLLWEMFSKKEPRELNKAQAGELLTALQ
jgi:hypothetical protein